MNQEIEKLLVAERKWKRELAELRALRERLARQVQPDQKLIAKIDQEIAKYLA